MAKVNNPEKVAEILKNVVKDRQKTRGETFFYLNRRANDVMWGNNDELLGEMKSWRKLRKNGVVKIMDYNNRTVKIQGKEWHVLVLQSTHDDDDDIDPTGWGHDDGLFLVTGFIYYFKSIQNRDATYKYVMRLT